MSILYKDCTILVLREVLYLISNMRYKARKEIKIFYKYVSRLAY